MKVFWTIAIVLVSTCAFSQELVGTWPFGGGPVTIMPAPGQAAINARGLDFNATGPYLSQGSSAAPFAFLSLIHI